MTTFNNNEYILGAGSMTDLNATAGTTPGCARAVVPFGGVVVRRYVVLDGAFTTTAALLNLKKNGTTVTGNNLSIAVAGSAADAVYGGDIAVPFEVAPGDALSLVTATAAGSAQSARAFFVIRR